MQLNIGVLTGWLSVKLVNYWDIQYTEVLEG
jgi:hypothetical protein